MIRSLVDETYKRSEYEIAFHTDALRLRHAQGVKVNVTLYNNFIPRVLSYSSLRGERTLGTSVELQSPKNV